MASDPTKLPPTGDDILPSSYHSALDKTECVWTPRDWGWSAGCGGRLGWGDVGKATMYNKVFKYCPLCGDPMRIQWGEFERTLA